MAFSSAVLRCLASSSKRCFKRSALLISGTSSNSSVMLGYMLLPTARSWRVANFLKRSSKMLWTASWTLPALMASVMPPMFSNSWNLAQDFSVNSSVNGSRYQLPPAGSTGWMKLNSCCSMIWMLRAIRRENSSLGRIQWSNGYTFMPSTPPTTAEKDCDAARNKLTYGSYTVWQKADVLTYKLMRWASSSPPQWRTNWDHSILMLRSLAISMKNVAPTLKWKRMWRQNVSTSIPRRSIARI